MMVALLSVTALPSGYTRFVFDVFVDRRVTIVVPTTMAASFIGENPAGMFDLLTAVERPPHRKV